MKHGIFATFRSEVLEDLLGTLHGLGFTERNISVLIPHVDDPRNLSLTDDLPQGVVTGGIVGAVAAEFGTIGTLLLTGVGSFVVAGPLLLTIGGAALGGAMAGGVVGGLVAGTGDVASFIGIPSSVVARCEEDLKQGRGLVLVEADSLHHLDLARQAFTDAGTDHIFERGEAA